MGRIINLDHIAKIEGHAALYIKVDKGEVKDVKMKVTEGARFFEGIVLDNEPESVPDIVSRICGFCSQIHQITGLKAIERALGIEVSDYVWNLREIIVLASVIQSHALHLLFFVLPDYFGFESAIAMAKKQPDYIKKALEIKMLSDNICRTIGGRAIHTLTPRVGGMSRFPTRKEAKHLISSLEKARETAIWMAELFDSLNYPNFARDRLYLALHDGKSYPFLRGNVVSSEGQSFEVHEYEDYISEALVRDSTAKKAFFRQKPYMVGALARLTINRDKISKEAKALLSQLKHTIPSDSPYMNNVAQAVENVHLIDKCIELLEQVDGREEEIKKPERREGRGIAITEAPRGVLIHDYAINGRRVERARIITPTVQNLHSLELDIKAYLPEILHMKEEKIKLELEKMIRAYDPCISCSAHFLKLVWQ
ncbi:hypothetical protein DRN74_01090 [Candidatus Micrarchaeota archaeon]|nr:MAG: hypothetical protein DRN74_01090 [Candidatus Micrarchaeota archaeon]